MKQCCLLMLVAIACVAMASAQDEDVLRPHGRGDNDGVPRTEPKQSTRFIIGPELGLNLNFFSSVITGGNEKSPLQVLKSGSGISVFGGAYFEVGLNRHFGIGMRVLYDAKSFSNTLDTALIDCEIPIGAGVIAGGFGTFTTVPIEVKFQESLTYLTLNPLLRWSPSEELILQIGPVIQVGVSGVTGTITRTIDPNSTCKFNVGTPDQSNVQVVDIADSVTVATRFGLDVGVGYRIAIAPSIALVPRIGYQYMVSNLGDDSAGFDSSLQNSSGLSPAYTITDVKLSSLQASIALWFTL